MYKRTEITGQIAIHKVGDINRQILRITTYLSRNPGAETSMETSARVQKPEL